ncbi:hypothetical protein CTI12_AA140060 [Artemisia annua]|uniref:Uncharacterized protein n=1 Tax=Artemisia annua TaxID=35608 RepID=A0A2U1PKT9_ARTAN|nr:hypothetical protein CTI12_AA140060 [Artemisia annua]
MGRSGKTDRYKSNGYILLVLPESICKTMNGLCADLYKEKPTRLTKLDVSLKDPQRIVAMSERYRLKYRHAKIWEGLIAKRGEHTEFHFPPDCERRTDPVYWSDPEDDCCTGMILRSEGTTCSGYDYYNPYCDGISVCLFHAILDMFWMFYENYWFLRIWMLHCGVCSVAQICIFLSGKCVGFVLKLSFDCDGIMDRIV